MVKQVPARLLPVDAGGVKVEKGNYVNSGHWCLCLRTVLSLMALPPRRTIGAILLQQLSLTFPAELTPNEK